MLSNKLRIGIAVLSCSSLVAVGVWSFFARITHGVQTTETPGTSSAHDTTLNPESGMPPAADTRQAFAHAMSKVREGMPEGEVLAFLGKPHDVQTQTDPGGISTSRTREIWKYGTEGHLTTATLGSVYIDTHGKAQYVYGGRGEPPDPGSISEAELRPLLRLIDTVPSYNSGYFYNPLHVIRVVNALQPLGKEKALAVIDEYLRVSSNFHAPAREGIFLVLRVLFDVPSDPGHMPHMFVGAPVPPGPDDPKRSPRFPILLQDDVPLLLVSGYDLGGDPEAPESHVRYFREKGRLRDKVLTPTNDALGLLASWEEAAGWLHGKDGLSDGKLLIANQILRMIDSVYRRRLDVHGNILSDPDDLGPEWKAIQKEVEKAAVRWDAKLTRYTFQDGSHLPDPVRKLYRRHIWQLEGMNGEASLILERTSDQFVHASLNWSGKASEKMPTFSLDVFAVEHPAHPLTKLSSMSINATAGDEVFSSQSSQIGLPEGKEVRARLTIGEREQTSPAYRP
jgi:hypothetical protein